VFDPDEIARAAALRAQRSGRGNQNHCEGATRGQDV